MSNDAWESRNIGRGQIRGVNAPFRDLEGLSIVLQLTFVRQFRLPCGLTANFAFGPRPLTYSRTLEVHCAKTASKPITS